MSQELINVAKDQCHCKKHKVQYRYTSGDVKCAYNPNINGG